MISKTLLKEALCAVAAEEIEKFDALPLVEAPRSESYLQAIEDLKRKCAPAPARWTPRKIAITIIAAILVALSVTACVYREEIKTKIQEIFFENKGDHLVITPTEPKLEKIEEFYKPTWVPDGFTEIEPFVSSDYTSSEWESGNSYISFEQNLLSNNNMLLDSEGIDYTAKEINGMTVYYGYKDKWQAHIFFWKTEHYMFSLTCNGEIAYDECVEILKNIKISS